MTHQPLRDVLESTTAALATAVNRLPKRTNPHVLEHLRRAHAEARAALAEPAKPLSTRRTAA